MKRAIRRAAMGAALLAAAGCATGPAPHPVLAQATPASAVSSQGETAAGAPAAAAPVAQGAPASTSASNGDDETRERRARRSARDLGWVSLGIGATAALVALGTGVVMLHDQSVRSSGCDANKLCTADGSNANTQLSQLGPWNAAAFGVAAVGFGLGAYLLLTHNAGSAAHTAVGVSPGGLVVQGSF
jgi:hypothetical protein